MVMEQEALPVINILDLKENKELETKIPLTQVFSNKINNMTITLIKPLKDTYFNIDFVGGEIASVLTYAGINQLKPDIVINAGTAGGISDDQAFLNVGDICTPQSMQFIDRFIDLAPFAKFSEGNYPITFKNDQILEKLNIKKLKIGTTQTFSNNNKAAYEKKVNVVEMECAAVSRICYQFNIPLFVLKVISDVDNSQVSKEKLKNTDNEHIADQFEANLQKVALKLAQKIQELLQYFSNNINNDLQNI